MQDSVVIQLYPKRRVTASGLKAPQSNDRGTVTAVSKKSDKKNKKDKENFLEEIDDGHSRLIIAQKPYTFKESFKIFDRNRALRSYI